MSTNPAPAFHVSNPPTLNTQFRRSAAGVMSAIAVAALAASASAAELNGDQVTLSFEQPAAASETPAATASTKASPTRTPGFLLSDERIHGDPEIFWPGFLSGLRGFEHFYEPVGNPLYFESPFINTNVKLLFLHHRFDEDSQLQGGHVNVYAAQARVAVTERIAIIATKDGWSQLEGTILPDAGGWNDIALGLKGAFWVDRENDFVMTGSFRWMWGNGDRDVLMGGSQEITPGIHIAKGFDNLHLLGSFVYRIPTDGDKGNEVAQWDLHVDYDLSDIGLKGVAPIFELHGLHYVSNGARTPLSVGGLDYTNLGSTDVAGRTVIWAGFGARVKLTPNVSFGATYETSLTDSKSDIIKDRVTVDCIFTW